MAVKIPSNLKIRIGKQITKMLLNKPYFSIRYFIKIHQSCHLPCTLCLNYFHFGNSCLSLQLSFIKNITQMFTDGWRIYIKQFRHCFLREPYRIALNPNIDANTTIITIKNKKARLFAPVWLFAYSLNRSKSLI